MSTFNFDLECQAQISRHVNSVLYSMFTYLAMVRTAFDQYSNSFKPVFELFLSQEAFYGQNRQALPGLSLFFKRMAQLELEDAKVFIDFQNERGGMTRFYELPTPNPDLSEPLNSIMKARCLTRRHASRLERMHRVAVTAQASEVNVKLN